MVWLLGRSGVAELPLRAKTDLDFFFFFFCQRVAEPPPRLAHFGGATSFFLFFLFYNFERFLIFLYSVTCQPHVASC
jgi:hypothetical protein